MKKQKEQEPVYFQEVKVHRAQSIVDGVMTHNFEVIKVERPKVKISQEEADILNHGRKEHTGNTIFTLFVKPGEKIEPLLINAKK